MMPNAPSGFYTCIAPIRMMSLKASEESKVSFFSINLLTQLTQIIRILGQAILVYKPISLLHVLKLSCSLFGPIQKYATF